MSATQFPGYRIGNKLGSGGSGEVFAAERLSDNRSVAIKRIPFRKLSKTARARVELERALCASIQHSNVVELLDWGTYADGAYLVFERLYGGTLFARLKARGRLSVAETLHVAREVAHGLGTLHARGAVHRDIKPANIFICQGERCADSSGPDAEWDDAVIGDFPAVKLLDLGVVRVAEDDPDRAHNTERGAVVGTACYMAPEQVLGKPIETSVDLYALGLVMYECLAGEPAIATQAGFGSYIDALGLKALPPLPGDVPLAVVDLIRRAASYESADRFPDARAFLAALDQNSGEMTVQLGTTTMLPGQVELGDLTIPCHGDWLGHQRFRDHLISAVTHMFPPGRLPASIADQMSQTQTLESIRGETSRRADDALVAAGRRAHRRCELLNELRQAETEVGRELSALESAEEETATEVDRRMAELDRLDRAYGAHHASLEQAQVSRVGDRRSVPYTDLFGTTVLAAFDALKAVQSDRIEAEVQVTKAQQARLHVMAEAADVRRRLRRAEADRAHTDATEQLEVDELELLARDAEIEARRAERRCEHGYLQLGVELHGVLSAPSS